MKNSRDFDPIKPRFLTGLCTLSLAVGLCLVFDIGNCASPEEGKVFSIHLFSFKGVEEAKAKVKEFNELGYNAFYRQEKSGADANAYDVYVEKFSTRKEAEIEASILKQLDLISEYEIREIMEKPKSIQQKEKQETKPARQDVRSYYLKVGSLREMENAEELVKKLQGAGYNAFYNYETVKETGDWYRVYIDEYKSREDAEKDARKLMESGVIPGYEIKRVTESLRAAETSSKDKIYTLHTASYRDGSHADDDVLRLSGLGLKAVSVTTEISGEQWFRVYVGEFSDESEARKAGAELIEKGVIAYFKPMKMDKSGEQKENKSPLNENPPQAPGPGL